MASIKDVANKAGVSISTVSNVISGTKFVSPELTKKVTDAVTALNFKINPMARGVKTGKSHTIGVITADISGLFYPYVIKGICEIANLNNYSVTIMDAGVAYNSAQNEERESACFKSLFSNRVDGIIFASSFEESSEYKLLDELQSQTNLFKQVALLSIERDLSHLGIDSIFYCNVGGAEKAVRHLLECGCKQVVHIAGPFGAPVVQDRIRGYLSTLQSAGYSENPEMIAYGDYGHQSGFFAMEQLLSAYPDLDGVFVANDQMAMGAYKALQKHGRNIPDDVKVIGFDDVFISNLVIPSLSSVHVRKKHMGIRAAQALINRIDGFYSGSMQDVFREELETALIVRESTLGNKYEEANSLEW